MATNYIEPGKVVTYANTGSAISSGDVVPLSNRCGVALVDIAATSGTGSVALDGVYTVPKATGSTWSVGQALYHDAGAGKITPTASGNTPAGFAFAAAASGDTTGQLLLGGQMALAEAANQAALGGTLTGTTDGDLADIAAIALSTSDTYTDAAVNTAVNTAITAANLQLKELQAAVNGILAKLKAAGLMVDD